MKKRGIVLILSGLFIIAAAVQAPTKAAPLKAQDIFKAVDTKNVAMVKDIVKKFPNSIKLLDVKKNLPMYKQSGNTPLHIAVWRGSSPIVKIILDQVSKEERPLIDKINEDANKAISGKMHSKDKKNPGYYTLKNQKPDKWDRRNLIAFAANQDKKMNTVLMAAAVIDSNRYKDIRKIYKDSLRFWGNKRGSSSFLLALNNMKNGTYREFCRNLKIRCDGYQSPLSIAASVGDKTAAKYFINLINVVDKNGRIPLHYAASNGNFDMVKFLVSKGSRVRVLDRPGVSLKDLSSNPYLNLQYDPYFKNRIDVDPAFRNLVMKGKTPEMIARLRLLKLIEWIAPGNIKFNGGDLTKWLNIKTGVIYRGMFGRVWLDITKIDPAGVARDDAARAASAFIPFAGPILLVQTMIGVNVYTKRIFHRISYNRFWDIISYLAKIK